MILDQAIAEVQQIIGWRSDKVAEITNALTWAQNQRELPGKTFPWFLRGGTTINTVAGTHSYTIPSNFIQESEPELGDLFILTGDGTTDNRTIFLNKLSFKVAQQKYFGTWPSNGEADPRDQSSTISPGIPREFVLGGVLIFFYPVPDAVYSINWTYWSKAATLATGQENAWLKYTPWSLIGDAALKIASDLGNSNAIATATRIKQMADGDLFQATIGREEAAKKRSMGSRL